MLKVNLNNVSDVKDFVNIAGKQDFRIDLCNSKYHYVVDAKSIMGVFSLDLSSPVEVLVEDKNIEKATQLFAKFMA